MNKPTIDQRLIAYAIDHLDEALTDEQVAAALGCQLSNFRQHKRYMRNRALSEKGRAYTVRDAGEQRSPRSAFKSPS